MSDVSKYEQKKQELESIVETLKERGKNMSISELLDLADRGNQLSEECSKWLFRKKEEVEEKINSMNEDYNA